MVTATTGPIEEIFWSKVQIGNPDECWPWLGSIDRDGYPIFTYKRKAVRAHRFAFELVFGYKPITADHECHNSSGCNDGKLCLHRRCCNPSHLADKTIAQNSKSSSNWSGNRTHCVNGHELSGTNLFIKDGFRRCRECARERRRESYYAARGLPVPPLGPSGRKRGEQWAGAS